MLHLYGREPAGWCVALYTRLLFRLYCELVESKKHLLSFEKINQRQQVTNACPLCKETFKSISRKEEKDKSSSSKKKNKTVRVRDRSIVVEMGPEE